ALARPLPFSAGTSCRRHGDRRTEPLALSLLVGRRACPGFVLSYGQLVPSGAGAVRPGHGVARTGLSLAWPRRSRLRTGPRDDHRHLEAPENLPNHEFHGLGGCPARARIPV